MTKFILVLFALMFVACSSAKKHSDSAQSQVTPPAPVVHESPQSTPQMDTDIIKKEVCESGQDKRLLEIHKKKPGCELAYTKFGKSSIVSSGKHGTKHCEDSLDKITKKLEEQKFKCDAS